MEKIIKAQLNKLNTDYIDYYLVHALEKKSWEKMKSFGVLEFLEGLKKDQRIINTGFSYHGDRDTFKEIIDAYNWDICQIQYNYLDVQNQAGRRGLKYADKKHVSVIIMGPLHCSVWAIVRRLKTVITSPQLFLRKAIPYIVTEGYGAWAWMSPIKGRYQLISQDLD